MSWVRGAGLRTGRVDTGEIGGIRYKASPVILWDFRVRPYCIEEARRLIERSSIEEGLRESILKRLEL